MVEAGGKHSNKILIGVLLFFVFIAVGLTVGIIVVNVKKEDGAMVPGEEWAAALGECLYDFNTTATDCSSFENGLKKTIDVSDDEYTRVTAGISLATLYAKDDINVATNLLEEMYDDDLSDESKYRILKTLISYYKDSNNELKYVEKLQEIVELPDSMELKYEDWKMIKAMFISELEAIENVEIDDGAE